MPGNGDPYDMLMDRLADPYTRGRIRRALAMDLVLDTWLNGEREESFTEEAQEIISRAVENLTRQALAAGAVFPGIPMPEGYVRSVFQELLSSTALYRAQKCKGVREVDRVEATHAETILRRFVATERDGLTGAAGIYFVISAHEDLNAIRYYRRMKREDFLLGTLHRPWSDMMLTNQLDAYLRMGLVKVTFTGEGETLELTGRGEKMLGVLRQVLEESGEFEWRSNAQRWVIFGETDYDNVFNTVFPDMERFTREYIQELELPQGARVLEIGAGTGRLTFDLGLAARVAEVGGSLVAVEPSGTLLNVLREKSARCGGNGVELVQGMAESLPFSENSFDVVVAFAVLHFTELRQAVAEMSRVTKPGGLVTAVVPSKFDLMEIPMVSMWFDPLRALSRHLEIPFGERQGLPDGKTESEFRESGLEDTATVVSGTRIHAGDSRGFLQFFLKGGAFFQNILSRLPFQERWGIIRLLDKTGGEIAATGKVAEIERCYRVELVYGRKP